jgi:hypothetical protein
MINFLIQNRLAGNKPESLAVLFFALPYDFN